MTEIGKNIKQIRERKGMSISSVSIAAGTSQPILREYENGEREPDAEAISRIADALYVPISYLINPELFEAEPIVIPPAEKLSKKAENVIYNKRYDFTIYNIVRGGLRFSPETHMIYNCYKEYVLNIPAAARTEEHNLFLGMVDELLHDSKGKRKNKFLSK